MNEIRLKPCPFCGFNRVAIFLEKRTGTKFSGYIQCSCCDAKAGMVFYDSEEKARDGAVRAWNKRAYNDEP